MNISKVIPGFHNGVSQQSPTMRLDTQVEAAENMLGSLVTGTGKRPNTDFIAVLNSIADDSAFIHTIERDAAEKYIVVMTGDPLTPLEVFTLDGEKCTVKYGTLDESFTFTLDASVMQYLDTAGYPAKTSFKAVTIADHTFIVNKMLTPTMGAAVSHSGGSLDGSVQSFDKLTDVTADEGEVWEVSGNDTNHFDNYYVQKQTGTMWLETIAPNIPYVIEPGLMPHRLVRTALNEFTLAPIVWEDRTCGDDASAPVPSFIGNPITNIFFFRNRLGFLSGDNIVLSAAGDYYRFFPKTALDILDDDPIDVAASIKEVSPLYSVAGFNKALLIFGNPQQFSLSSGDNSLLTPATVSLDGTTRFAIQTDCEPVALGSTVYFANPREQHLSIREYLVQENTLMDDAADITAHCPDYIPMGDITLKGITSMDMLFVHSSGDPSALYVYKFYWTGNQKAQSAWHRWTFADPILGMSVIDETLLILFNGAETRLESLKVENLDDGDLDFRCHLDHKCELRGVYDGFGTKFTLPYTPTLGDNNIGGIDKYTTLMLQSDNPGYIGKATGGNDDYTRLLIHSDSPSGSVFVDSSADERAITLPDESSTEDNPVHSASGSKFGQSSIRFANNYRSTLNFTCEGETDFTDISLSKDFTIDCWVYLPEHLSYLNDDTFGGVYGLGNPNFMLFQIGHDGHPNTQFFRFFIAGSGVEGNPLVGDKTLGIIMTDHSNLEGNYADANDFLLIRNTPMMTSYICWVSELAEFPTGVWQHVALERHNNKFSVYRQGRKVIGFDFPWDFPSDLETTQYAPPPGIILNATNTPTPTAVFTTYVDEYRISSVARYRGGLMGVGSQVFLPESYMYGVSPIVYETTVEDHSPLQHEVETLGNVKHYNNSGWPIKFDRSSLYFDGGGDGLEIPDSEEFDFTTNNFTVDWWMNLQSQESGVIFQKYDTDDYGWRIVWEGDAIGFHWSPDGDDLNALGVNWDMTLTTGVWVHFALVRDAEVITLYVNGVSFGSRTFAGTVRANTQPLLIGTAGNDGVYAAFEEIRVSNIARWTSQFIPPFGPYTAIPGGIFDGLNGGIPVEFDPATMDPARGLQMLLSYYNMDIVHPVTGMSYPEATISGMEIYVPRENLEAYDMIVGRNYTGSLTLSPIYMMNSKDQAMLDGRLQLRTMTISVRDTGFFYLHVTPAGRNVATRTYTGAILGASALNRAPLWSKELRFLLMARAAGTTISLSNSSYFPSNFVSCSVEGTFIKRNKPV
jgi:hypothetical protein